MKILSIILARGGSKGLPQKNIIDLNGKPLIAYTISASLNSRYITKTIVSSDDEKILDKAKQYGAEIIRRPDELAQDTTPTEPAIEHVLKNTDGLSDYSYLVLLQPTSPLRNEIDIDEAIETLIKRGSTALISVVEIDNKVLKAFKVNDEGYIEGISNNFYPFMRRQDLPGVYMPNGAIYIVEIKEFLKTKSLFTNKTISYIMGEERSIDVDTKEDLFRIEQLMKGSEK